MNKKSKKRVVELLEHLQSVIQEIQTHLSELTPDDVITKWLPILTYAKIPEENYEDCAYELEAIEINFYSTLIRTNLIKQITEIYSTVPPKIDENL
jgi:predicted transcriptional regulator